MTVPETRYAPSGEILIAYQDHGGPEGRPEILFSGSVASNVETAWSLPEARRLFERLTSFARLVRFDRRDTGVSDPIRDDLTLEAHVADALAVIDEAGLVRPFVIGATDGGRSMAALAATQPERVAGLVAYASTVRGGAAESPEIAERTASALATPDWPAGVVDFWAPELKDDSPARDRFIRYVRTSATPRQARRLLRMSLQSDVSEVLPLVQAPALVLRPGSSELVSEEAVRDFAGLIPNGTYRELPGVAALTLYMPEIDLLADLIEEFITGSPPRPISNRVLATVLFTDLVESTRRAGELGDRTWTELLERHHRAGRRVVGEHGGETVKTLGDGVLATFTGPAQAVRCAEEIVARAKADGLQVRAGIHTGELEIVGDDVAGMAVHLGARIMSLAQGGEVLVSRTVRDLVVGSELRFDDRGEHQLKGIDERWGVYALV